MNVNEGQLMSINVNFNHNAEWFYNYINPDIALYKPTCVCLGGALEGLGDLDEDLAPKPLRRGIVRC